MIYIPRKVFLELKNHIDKKEISFIVGPRQAGKTTIMKRIKKELEDQDKATVFFNLDIIEDKQFFKTQHTLVEKIKSEVGLKKAYVFIDEVHRIESPGLFLKGLYDMETGYKFIVSGSGSLELKKNLVEPMTGRKKIFYCLPLSFTEFASFKLKTNFAKLEEKLKLDEYKRERLIKEYLSFGGYPRVVISNTDKEKKEILSEIFLSYLEKDIQLLLGIKKTQAFRNLVKILANQAGNLINRAELSATLQITEKTVKKYLNLLEKTFIISLCRPFYKNVRKELTKSPKVYFYDLGMLHFAMGQFPSLEKQTLGGEFENACFLRLKELELLEPIKYWRTNTGAEVDFVIFSPETGSLIPIEAKLSLGKKGILGKSLISFIKSYGPNKVYLYNLQKKASFNRFKTMAVYLPYWLLPHLNG